MNEKACCVAGHRDIPADKVEYVKIKLREEIEKALSEGFTTFISGFSEGVGLLFAELVIEQKERYPHLFLEAAIPYKNLLKTKDPLFQKCLAACSGVHVQQKRYTEDCCMNSSRYMLSLSDRVIAVYDGRDSGVTLFTMRCAHIRDKELHEIRI